jgi:hypothetical protein
MAVKSMTFEPTITLGGIIGPMITAVTFICAYIAYQFRLGKSAEINALLAATKFESIDTKLDSLNAAVSGIQQILRNQAEHNVRLDQLDKLVDELRHGKGYVLELEPHRRTF